MRLDDVIVGGRYIVKGDEVEVTEIEPGATPRSNRITFEIVAARSKRTVGFTRTWGLANFASWAKPA